MRAAVIDRPRTISIVETEVPEPGARQVQVRLHGSGICGSNVPVWEGRPWFTYPLPPGAPGHEGWGVVSRVGTDVTDLEPGARVALLSQRAFADVDVADADQVVRIPDELGELPFPGEAIACAVNVMRRAHVTAGQRVAVIGVGFLGAILVKLFALAGAEVTAVTRRRYALEAAAALGARNLVAFDDVGATTANAKAANGNREFDVVIEAVGVQSALDMGTQLTATRGRLVIAGYHQDGPRQVDMQTWNWRGLDVINAHERDPHVYVEGMREAARLVQRRLLPLASLVTHAFPMEDAAEAFRCAVERPPGFLKAVVVTHAA
jgi:2-desacetyl-2-hydroxyethyl bacteriochlorophyllide A dehydrogenase